ncbi:hypothetical protein OEG84_03905 [Hoeflea sp. G2-23]|uniref:Uncharacterized protein n=1 Tax=Hoeflea algicola TaxID=2983763 RepID=A0ABT3Z556_9HYPH|nr:hypothetical protein [Hoeflea algicola]MCY0146882.1 hypothetical protein [Hoeflea algicola]
MSPALRLEKLQKFYAEKERQIIRAIEAPNVSLRQKQTIYACLNDMCQLSAQLYGELSTTPGNYDLLDQAGDLDEAWLQLRRLAGSRIPIRSEQAA